MSEITLFEAARHCYYSLEPKGDKIDVFLKITKNELKIWVKVLDKD